MTKSNKKTDIYLANSRHLRQKKVNSIEDKIPSLHKSTEEYNLPLMQLWDALTLYKAGFFGDSIIHSALAIELTLAFQLDNILTDSEKQKHEKRGGLEFGALIKISQEKEILNEEYHKLSKKICNMRNMLVHIGNFIEYIKDMKLMDLMEDPYFKQLVEEDQELSNVLNLRIKESQKNLSIKPIAEKLDSTLKHEVEKLNGIPNLKWMTRQDTLDFQKLIMKPYFKSIIKEMLSKKEFQKIIRKTGNDKSNIIRYIKNKYNYLEKASYETIVDSYRLLTYFKYIDISEKDLENTTFGHTTEEAVKDLQKKQELGPSGEVEAFSFNEISDKIHSNKKISF